MTQMGVMALVRVPEVPLTTAHPIPTPFPPLLQVDEEVTGDDHQIERDCQASPCESSFNL
jgi:hypothetical protein